MDKRTRNVLIVIAIIAAFSVGAASFTTIFNPPATVAPVFSWQYLDKDGAAIADIHTATISGTVTFKATITNSPNPDVANVKLTIHRTADNVYIGEWLFDRTTQTFTLIFDTAQLPNGEYKFTFGYNVVVDDGGGGTGTEYLPFSVLTLLFDDGSGSETAYLQPIHWAIIAAAGIVAFVLIVRRR